MTQRERSESGQYVETVGLDDVLGVFDRVDGPVITSSDVADALECTTEAARQKLTRLSDRGQVGRRKTGRTMVYWRVDDRGHTTPSGGQADRSPSPAESARTATAADVSTDDVVDKALGGWAHGRDDAERQASRTVARQATEWLQDTPRETARKADVPLDDLAANDPIERSPETLWTEVVRDAWQHAAERGYIEQPHSRGYRWVGDGSNS